MRDKPNSLTNVIDINETEGLGTASIKDPIVVLSINEEGRVLFISRSIVRTIGYTPEEIYQLREPFLFSLVHVEDQEGLRKFLKIMLKDDYVNRKITFKIRHKQGSWFQASYRVLFINRIEDLCNLEGLLNIKGEGLK